MGPSGSGKTTLGQWLKQQSIPELVSTTTRASRPGEIPGIHYNFVSREEFDTLDKIEQTEYVGNKYCLTRQEVENKLAQYGEVFAVVDKNGLRQIKEQYPALVRGIFIYTPKHLLIKRMVARGNDMNFIVERINNAEHEGEMLENIDLADYCIINKSTFEDATHQLTGILENC